MRFSLGLPGRVQWKAPTLGRVLLVIAEFILVIVLCFYRTNPNDQWEWEDLGYRTGPIALAQLPLIFILSGKKNIVGYLIGSSYERLSWLHRWTARVFFLTVTIHMSYWFRSWARYEYIADKVKSDPITQRGLAAWCILLWIVLSSLAPIRRWNYELFVLQHVITVAGLAAAIYLHVPDDLRVWVWVSVGFAMADRVVRFLSVIYINISLFHRKHGQSRSWAHEATFEPLGSNMTRILLPNPSLKWTPGQHVMLSCHSIAPLQSHPFTIASIPQDGRMELLVQSKCGATKRLFSHAQKYCGLPVSNNDRKDAHTATVAIEGPYGFLRPLAQFDSVVLIAGGCGSTFTMPLLRDLIHSWKTIRGVEPSLKVLEVPSGAVTRTIRFVWVVKSKQQFEWFAAQLVLAAQEVEQLKVDGHNVNLEINIYITCDELLKAQATTPVVPFGAGPHETAKVAKLLEEKDQSDSLSEHPAIIKSDEIQLKDPGCGGNNACCCTRTIEDENASSGSIEECLCNKDNETVQYAQENGIHSPSSGDASSASAISEKMINQPYPDAITIHTGRPCPEIIIRKMAERALGESAVIVCGPSGLVDSVCQGVVVLSDERAIHKGTGAQGIYLHTEAFDY